LGTYSDLGVTDLFSSNSLSSDWRPSFTRFLGFYDMRLCEMRIRIHADLSGHRSI
jgi:hypothetical protein